MQFVTKFQTESMNLVRVVGNINYGIAFARANKNEKNKDKSQSHATFVD